MSTQFFFINRRSFSSSLYHATRLRWNSNERARGPLEDNLIDDVVEWCMWHYLVGKYSSSMYMAVTQGLRSATVCALAMIVLRVHFMARLCTGPVKISLDSSARYVWRCGCW